MVWFGVAVKVFVIVVSCLARYCNVWHGCVYYCLVLFSSELHVCVLILFVMSFNLVSSSMYCLVLFRLVLSRLFLYVHGFCGVLSNAVGIRWHG